MIRRITSRVVALLAAVAISGTDAAWACTVCYGSSESAIIQGAQQATLLMVGVTYLLLSGGVATFLMLRRRFRNTDEAAAREGASR